MSLRRFMGNVLLSGLSMPWVAIVNAQRAPVTVEQVLSQLEVNTDKYMASVPSFVCDEHITSQESRAGKIKHETKVEAVFRVSRSARQPGLLEESREVRSVDGKASDGKKLSMPLAFSGGFSGVLTKFLSSSHQQCFSYRQQDTSSAGLTFSFVANDASLQDPACRSIQRGTTGRVNVDLAAMQVTHIERTVPFPIGKDQSVLSTASVDFVPVALNGTTFWLPATVTASTNETPKTDRLFFEAHYDNYHRYGATSTIISVSHRDVGRPLCQRCQTLRLGRPWNVKGVSLPRRMMLPITSTFKE